MAEKKPNKLSWPEYGCYLALIASSRSCDPHSQSGAVGLDKDHKIVSTGFNGFAPGMEAPIWINEESRREEKCELIIHAEQNLFARAKRGEIFTLCLDKSPCNSCARTIIAYDVKEVFYLKEYHRENKFKKIFDFYKIKYTLLDKNSIENILEKIQEKMDWLKEI